MTPQRLRNMADVLSRGERLDSRLLQRCLTDAARIWEQSDKTALELGEAIKRLSLKQATTTTTQRTTA